MQTLLKSWPLSRACGLAWPWCLELIEMSSNVQVAIDGVGYNAAMKACGDHGKWWLSLVFLKLSKGARSICSSISSIGGKAWEVSMLVMTEAESSLVESDVAIHNAALSALAGNDQWRATLELQRLRFAGLEVGPGTVNPLAMAAGRGRSWRSLVSILEGRHCQDAAALGAVVSALAQAKAWTRCLELLSVPVFQHHSESAVASYNALITMFGQSALPNKAIELLEQVVSSRLRPSIVTFNAAMDALTSGRHGCYGCWLTAIALLQAISSQRLQPDHFTYYYAIHACENCAATLCARRLLEELNSSKEVRGTMHVDSGRVSLRKPEKNGRRREPGTLCFKHFVSRGLLASTVWVPRQWLAMLLDQFSSFCVLLNLMASPDTVIVNITAVLSVLCFVEYLKDLHMNLTWTAISFSLVFPLQTAIREAFKRREAALMALAEFRATSTNVFLANQLWDWPGADGWYGRFEDNVPKDQGGKGVKKGAFKDTPLNKRHADRVLEIMLRLMDAMQEFLLVPRRGRGRQEFCVCVSPEKEQVEAAEMKGRNAVLKLLARLHKAVEDLKAAGMPANEASRINQYNMFLSRNFEKLWSFKTYRTPTTLRAVCRVNIQLMPFFFGPYYVHLARNEEDGEIVRGRLIFACIFSCLLSTTLVALLNVAILLENPFRPGIDTLRIQEEFYLCREALITVAGEAEVDWHQKVEFEWEIIDNHQGCTSSEESA
eukprot:s2944_g10.t2